MKRFTLKFLFLSMTLLSTIGIFAQPNSGEKNTKEIIPLKPLFEMFTSSTCGPCAYANPIFDEMMDANPGTHSVIKYQMDWPGVGDPYYIAEAGVRRYYYGVNSVPDLFVNAQDESPSGVTQEIYDGYLAMTTSLEIEVLTAEIDLDNVINIEVNLNALDNYDAGLIAHVVVVEKLTVENVASNGETEFHNVMMKMLPDASGTTLPTLTNGNTETLSFTFDMDNTFMETANDLRVIIFVQDDSDKSVIQSEQVEVAHSLDDYTITFNMLDFNSNPVEGAHLLMESYGGRTSDASGMIVYEGVLPGTYTYAAEAAGLIPTDGSVNLIDEDLNVDVMFGDPGYYYFEDFTDEIPVNYTLHVEYPDYLYWADGRVILFRQSGTIEPLMMVCEMIDITPGEKLWFDIGEQGGDPLETIFGTLTDPFDPETFVEIATIIPGVEWETYEYLLEDILPGQVEVYFAWKHNTSDMSFFSIDNIKINYKDVAETYKAYFSVYDGSSPVEGAEITINGNTQITDDNGSALFYELVDGVYDYTIIATGYMDYDDQFEVNGSDENVEVNLLIDGIQSKNTDSPKIYPNPCTTVLNIELDETINTIEILDLTGKKLGEFRVNNNKCQLDLSNYSKGIYIMKANLDQNMIWEKFIIE